MKDKGSRAHRSGGWSGAGVVFCSLAYVLPCLAGDLPSASAAPLTEGASLLSAIVKVFGSLLVVVGLMLVVLYFIKRAGFGVGRGRVGSAIVVLESRMVAPKKYVAIVEIAGKCLALGITDHNINLLADLGPEAKAALVGQSTDGKPGLSFAGMLAQSMKSWQVAEPAPSASSVHEDKKTEAST